MCRIEAPEQREGNAVDQNSDNQILNDDSLDKVSGGKGEIYSDGTRCPACGSSTYYTPSFFICDDCGFKLDR